MKHSYYSAFHICCENEQRPQTSPVHSLQHSATPIGLNTVTPAQSTEQRRYLSMQLKKRGEATMLRCLSGNYSRGDMFDVRFDC
jgi:hypothetical protein